MLSILLQNDHLFQSNTKHKTENTKTKQNTIFKAKTTYEKVCVFIYCVLFGTLCSVFCVFRLFNGNTLREVPWPIDIKSPFHRNEIREELERYDRKYR